MSECGCVGVGMWMLDAGTLAPTAIGAQFDFIIKKIHEEKLRPCTLELLTTPVVGGG